MLLGISVEESVRLFGHDHASSNRELAMVLDSRGMLAAAAGHLVRAKKKEPPEHAILHVRWGRAGKHWVILWDGLIYDPSLEVPLEMEAWKLVSRCRIGCWLALGSRAPGEDPEAAPTEPTRQAHLIAHPLGIKNLPPFMR